MQENKQEKSPIKKRILEFLAESGISHYECYLNTGLSRGTLSQKNGISEENLMRFLTYYTNINLDWLIRGKGRMLVKVSSTSEEKTTKIPAVNEKISNYNSEESVIFKMYLEKDKEVAKLNEKIGILKERLRQKESDDISDNE